MNQAFIPDWNSFISAIIGGALALLGTFLTIRGSKTEREREDSRELITLFYFLNSKVSLITQLALHPEGIPIMSIVTEEELLNVRKLYSVASRAISLEDIGEIDRFCSKLRSLESIRNDWAKENSNKQITLSIYQEALSDALNAISQQDGCKGINEIGKRIEYYFSKELKTEYKGDYKYK